VIYDFRNGIIDSLFYRSSWGGAKGLSLERISFEEETNDSTNWTTSLSPNGSTPGAENSIENVPDYSRDDVVINEIMYDPAEDNSEFIEFLNLSGDSVNVGGWEIVDENGNKFKLSTIPLLVPANSYFLLAADSLAIYKYGLDESILKTIVGVTSLGLVNIGEQILLKDVKGNTIDSVWYSDKWQNDNFISTKNISLERINPNLGSNDANNWSSSVKPIGATPGEQNSIYTINTNTASNISVSPNPFSPDNDGYEDFTIINYNLTQATSQVQIKIYDSKGRLVRTLSNNMASGSSGSVIFDGIGDDGQALRIGIYIIFLEAINEGVGVVESMKTVVVVARKL
ncbi:MAG: lamin tail domain-containing protein, partial [Ignavibacteriaceae bacterium]|nr:lamin tail domain-containing protein [Ignavibacteriaceae bacterium]